MYSKVLGSTTGDQCTYFFPLLGPAAWLHSSEFGGPAPPPRLDQKKFAQVLPPPLGRQGWEALQVVIKASESCRGFLEPSLDRSRAAAGGPDSGAHFPARDSSEAPVFSVLRALGTKGARGLALESPWRSPALGVWS